MITLGIEGTAHTIGVGIVENHEGHCQILSNIINTYRPKKGGIHPREAANHHAEKLPQLIQEALLNAHLDAENLDLISFSQGPGLGPCLRTAATGARALALSLSIPLIGVNHCVAHLEIGRGLLPACKDPVLLYVSGANTQVIGFAQGKYRVFGETLDIGMGNCLDKFGRHLGFPFPSGPVIEKFAAKGSTYHPLPYSIKGMDLAFSGILTAAKQLSDQQVPVEDICYSLQETTFAMLTEVTERAMAHTEKQEVLLGGGVVCNKRLQDMVCTMAKKRKAECFIPPKSTCVDNGAMIAWLGFIMYQSGVRMSIDESMVDQRFRTDMVEVTWREQ